MTPGVSETRLLYGDFLDSTLELRLFYPDSPTLTLGVRFPRNVIPNQTLTVAA